MIQTNPVTYTPLSGSANQVASKSLEEDDFLQLLVTQLRHQDPLSPMESQEFATQLAQFSSLEQLKSIDGRLEESINIDLILTQAINNTLASTLIGKEVTALGNEIEMNHDSPAEITFKLNGFADEVKVEILDSGGNVVRTLTENSMAAGKHTLEWDGENNSGEELPEGKYTFRVTAETSDGTSVAAIPMITGYITSIRYENGTAVLQINGREVAFSDVLEIGESRTEE